MFRLEGNEVDMLLGRRLEDRVATRGWGDSPGSAAALVRRWLLQWKLLQLWDTLRLPHT